MQGETPIPPLPPPRPRYRTEVRGGRIWVRDRHVTIPGGWLDWLLPWPRGWSRLYDVSWRLTPSIVDRLFGVGARRRRVASLRAARRWRDRLNLNRKG